MISHSNFDYVRQLVRQHAGIVVDGEQQYLAESRLSPIVGHEQLDSLDDLVNRLRDRPWSDLHRRVVEAMVTTETMFFRDAAVFETLQRTILPRLIEARTEERALTICSAACSSGQEAYSLVMVLQEFFPEVLSQWTVRIIGLDISNSMLSRARAGLYSVLEMGRGLPAALLTKHFQRDGMRWQVRPHLRSPIEFRQVNLTTEPIPGSFDLIFLRNVLMYFDDEMKSRVLDKARQSLRPDGTLFVGATESILSDENFQRESVHGTTYYHQRRHKAQTTWKSSKKISPV